MKKKVDERIRTLLENGVKLRHRSMVVVVGDKYRDQVVTLHYLLRNAALKSSPSVLWCYRDQLELSSHKRKRLKQHKRLFDRGFIDKDKDSDPFLTFVATNRLTHCKYRDSERVLGNTFGMCVLQDFEALTPNLLARTIETVEGGGLVVMVLRSLLSLTSLFTMVMDVHQRFRTESHSHGAGRFNERFLLSIASCKACVVMDDELNILPISSHIRSLMPVIVSKDIEGLSEAERELQNLKEELQNEFLVGPLVKKCCTMDQGKALVTFFDAILNKTLQSIVALTAARGRGKSAALGLAIAGAVAAGFSNIFVTAPSPENLKTLFEFVCSGLGSLEYKEHLHYDLVRSADSNLKKSIVRINIYKQHRQTIQYLRPNDQKKLSQVELLVIDEAAAIPLPIVKSMLGPYLVFLSSTVNGYEGTGRSLSLKLLEELQKQTESPVTGCQGMNFKRIKLTESIRYASKDPIESWLNGLLCLDVANHVPSLSSHPLPDDCVLYYVNQDTLFSYHKDSEIFLQRMMALYVASHYKNSPNDLQLMADAPAHHLFVLLGPVDESKNELPDIFCVIQVCLEGKISQKSVIKSLSEGHSPSGDQIPWKFSEQFRDDVFPTLSGVRIVRIAVHPSATGRGYGRQALKLLTSYYEGKFTSFAEIEDEENEEPEAKITEIAEKVSLLEENITPRANLPPLLIHLSERKPEKLHYIGVSFGLTPQLLRFWTREKFAPFYICQIPNDVTGEHSCMVLKALNNSDIENGKSTYGFIFPYYLDFRERFIQLLGGFFRKMDYNLALGILELKENELDKSKESSETIRGEDAGENPAEHSEPLGSFLSPHAMKRLEDYTNNFVDYHTIMDLVPILACRYFLGKLPTKIKLTLVQKSILLCMGLQHKDLSELEIGEGKLKLEKGQLISQFNKIMKKIYKELNDILANEIGANLPPRREILMEPLNISLDDDLREAEKEVIEAKRTEAQTSNGEMEALQDSELLRRYAIVDKDAEFEKARLSKSGLVSIKTTMEKKRKETHKRAEKSNEKGKGKNKSHSYKKKRNN